MLGLKIHLNGQVAAVMGAENAESLQVTIMAKPGGDRTSFLLTHGSVHDSPGYRTMRQWLEPRHLNVGESVSVEVVDVANPDPGTIATEHGRKIIGERSELFCSWCGKSEHAANKLVAGPDVCICDECIKLIGEIMDES